MIRGIIFDIDGTLLDSNDAHAESFRRAFIEDGFTFNLEAIRRQIGKGGDHLFPDLLGVDEKSTLGKKISDRKKDIFMHEFLPDLQAFPQAKELVQTLHDQGMKIGIATSASEEEVDQYLKIIGIKKFVDSKTSATEVKHSKPDPDLVGVALQKLKLEASDCLMVGDTPYDIQAAAQAGVSTIAFLSGGWSRDELRSAIVIFKDPADWLSQFPSVMKRFRG